MMVKSSTRNIRAFCQRKRSDVRESDRMEEGSGGACEGETSGVGGVRDPEGSSQSSSKDSSTRSSSGTTVKRK